MNSIVTQPSAVAVVPAGSRLPEPRTSIEIRQATIADMPAIDELQKPHTRQLGWMPTQQLEGKIKQGHVIIATAPGQRGIVGYCIGNDQYSKRDDCGIIYQLCVDWRQRRGLVGAALVKAMFERAAYGCRLFCCWCAQDLEANHFWESLGFVPLAFRSGSRVKARVHIFWQKRIIEGDQTTPYWYPSQTSGGTIREDRLVLPIPPGTHWSEAKPVVLPGMEKVLPPGGEAVIKSQAPKAKKQPKEELPINVIGGLWEAPPSPPTPPPAQKPKPSRRPSLKHDPKHVAAARELRDRYLEEVNRDPSYLLPQGKYDVARALPERVVPGATDVPMLPAA